MLSLIEVTCPHCGVQGQIMLPPLGAIIIGPCPECSEMVVVFSGRVLALDKEIMQGDSAQSKRDHLMEVLRGFLEERVSRLFEDADDFIGKDALAETGEEEADAPKVAPYGNAPTAPITREEVDAFRHVDLSLIDNRHYFKAVFD